MCQHAWQLLILLKKSADFLVLKIDCTYVNMIEHHTMTVVKYISDKHHLAGNRPVARILRRGVTWISDLHKHAKVGGSGGLGNF